MPPFNGETYVDATRRYCARALKNLVAITWPCEVKRRGSQAHKQRLADGHGAVVDEWYDNGYVRAMKTAVSVPDDLFERADHLAYQLGIGRSELYARALRELVDRLESAAVTKQLNAAYASVDSSLPPELVAAARRTLLRSEW